MIRRGLYCPVFLLVLLQCNAQVYNYLPISYTDAETNPTILVSDRYKNYLLIQHQNDFSSVSPFSISRITATKYLSRIFSGIGLTVSNTNQFRNTYNHLALEFAYRNILFNKVYVRLGVTGKLIQSSGTQGYFGYFSFTQITNKEFTGNMNASIAFASEMEKYFISFSALNINPAGISDSLSGFPKYYVFHVGNFMSIIQPNNRTAEISFTVISKINYNHQNDLSAFVNIYYPVHLNRRTSLLLGGRFGLNKGNFSQFIPAISLYKKKYLISLMYSFFSAKNSYLNYLTPTYQLNLNFKL